MGRKNIWDGMLFYMFWMSCRVASISSCRCLFFSFSPVKSSVLSQVHSKTHERITPHMKTKHLANMHKQNKKQTAISKY